jgi:thymidylate synthase (FAD)
VKSDYQKKIDLYGDGKCTVEYVQHMGDDLTIVNAARVSFGKHKMELDKKDKKLIKYLINHKHTSTFEHCQVTFRCTVPLFVRSQHHRHRTFSYNEISRRYTDFNLEFYEPKYFRTQHKSNRQASNSDAINPEIDIRIGTGELKGYYKNKASHVIKRFHADAIKLFDAMLNAGVCREQARGVLPQNLLTEYYASANLNNILKFIDLRAHEGAQWEIQQLAKGMLEIVSDLFPEAIKAYTERSGRN